MAMKPLPLRPDVVYPSDLSAARFEVIRPLLQSARKKTAPRNNNLHQVCNAVLYLLREGCRWRSLPRDNPDWRLCYYYYQAPLESLFWKGLSDHRDSMEALPVIMAHDRGAGECHGAMLRAARPR
jgi:transposase